MELGLLVGLGLTAAGDTFLVSSKSADAGEEADHRPRHHAAIVAPSPGVLKPSGVGVLGTLLGWVATVGVFVLAGLRLFGQGRGWAGRSSDWPPSRWWP